MTRGKPNPRHHGLPERLRRARKTADLAASALSFAAELSSATVGRIERGDIPTLDTIERLARVLELSPCWLAFGIEGPPSPADRLLSSGAGARLQAVREQRGLSRSALGEASGTSNMTVMRIEESRGFPRLDTLEKLAKVLGVSPCWLAYGDGNAPG